LKSGRERKQVSYVENVERNATERERTEKTHAQRCCERKVTAIHIHTNVEREREREREREKRGREWERKYREKKVTQREKDRHR
jgi:hypothetical protein